MNAVGLFDDALNSCGDLEWGQRALKAGYSFVYAQDAIVTHPVRTSLKSLIQQARRVAGGRFELKIKQVHNKLTASPGEEGIERALHLPISGPIASLRVLWTKKRLKTLRQKLGVIFLGLLIRVISATETLKLKLGGDPKR